MVHDSQDCFTFMSERLNSNSIDPEKYIKYSKDAGSENVLKILETNLQTKENANFSDMEIQQERVPVY